MLPDNDALKALLAASTPVPWQREIQTTADGYGRACGPDAAIPSDDAKMLAVLTRLDKDAQLIALAPWMAEEVIHLRERLATVEGERDEARAEAAQLREQFSPTTPTSDDEPAQITASWKIVGTKAQLHADDNSDMIGAYWQRASGDWSAGTPQGVTVHGKREDAVTVVEKWAKNCGFLVRQ